MNVIAILKALPALLALVEQLFPGRNRGAEKLDALVALVEGVVGQIGDMRPALEKLVGKLVEIKNAIGEFRKG